MWSLFEVFCHYLSCLRFVYFLTCDPLTPSFLRLVLEGRSPMSILETEVTLFDDTSGYDQISGSPMNIVYSPLVIPKGGCCVIS